MIARLEQTSFPNRIQVSQQCADLIAAGGKTHWLKERETSIIAKGKGRLQTYWVKVRSSQRRGSSNGSASMSSVSRRDDDDYIDEKRKERLIGWNTDQLVNILKQIVAHRNAQKMAARESKVVFPEECKVVSDGGSLLDEVKEIIELPEYNQNVTCREVDPDTIEIPKDVIGEIREYVAAVSSLYHDNHFHNFEHASSGTCTC